MGTFPDKLITVDRFITEVVHRVFSLSFGWLGAAMTPGFRMTLVTPFSLSREAHNILVTNPWWEN
jgi:hypothetical protein